MNAQCSAFFVSRWSRSLAQCCIYSPRALEGEGRWSYVADDQRTDGRKYGGRKGIFRQINNEGKKNINKVGK